jgi:hypothetical protein
LMAIGSLLYWVARPLFGDNPYDIFLVCGVIAVVAWFITLTIRNHECH